MPDETNAVEEGAGATVETAVPAEAPKKQRAPRRVKATLETRIAETKEKPGKLVKERKKRGPKASPASASNANQTAAASKPQQDKATAPASAADEMADLLRLEEENKALRQELAEKLRTENEDLRKRLGRI